jgi:hypothetical protein
MSTRTFTDAIDSRVIFKVYAATAWVAGTCLLG